MATRIEITNTRALRALRRSGVAFTLGLLATACGNTSDHASSANAGSAEQGSGGSGAALGGASSAGGAPASVASSAAGSSSTLAGAAGVGVAGSGAGAGAVGGGAAGGVAGAPSGGTGNSGSAGGAGAGGSVSGVADDCTGATAAALSGCTGTSPISCNFGGAVGHYDVKLLLGGPSAASTSGFAESRRFMFPETQTVAQASQCVSFTVNVRQPEGQPQEATAAPGLPGLQLRLDGNAPHVTAVLVTKAVDPVVVYLAGDSTVCDQDPQLDLAPASRYTGWGQVIPQYFGHGLSIANYADSGENSSSFRAPDGSFWKPIEAGLKAGDYVIIQLGHNDKTTPAATYHANILSMINATKAKNATPILVTPMVRNTGQPLAQQHIYGDLNVRSELLSLSMTESVTLIDLMLKSSEWATMLGQTAAQAYFVPGQTTHSNEAGAQVFGGFVIDGVRASGLPIVKFLR